MEKQMPDHCLNYALKIRPPTPTPTYDREDNDMPGLADSDIESDPAGATNLGRPGKVHINNSTNHDPFMRPLSFAADPLMPPTESEANPLYYGLFRRSEEAVI